MTAMDITGDRYGRLVAVRRIGSRYDGALWLFRCDCGASFETSPNKVRTGNTLSCGCLRIEKATALAVGRSTHGAKGTKEYRVWAAMRDRCYRSKHRFFARYGGRGITICERWATFPAFLEDMGPAPSGNRISLDRIDNDGNYEPGNCRWATTAQQSVNRSNSRILMIGDEALPLCEAARRYGISRSALGRRLDAGWDIHRAISQPARVRKSRPSM